MASSAFLVFKIFLGRTPEPPFQRCIIILQSDTAQHKTSWKSDVYNSRSDTHTQVESTSQICDLLAKDLLYTLSVKHRAGKDKDPVKMLKIQC